MASVTNSKQGNWFLVSFPDLWHLWIG